MKSVDEMLKFYIINVDKPSGQTSFDTVDHIRKILGAKKAGHFGTLDPMVTGVLPIALNKATRLSGYFMGHDKEYVGEMKIHGDIGEDELRVAMDKFVGKIMQKPPVRSKVKRVLREREVSKFEILGIDGKIVRFHCVVQAGTYIRKLVSDLGEYLGCGPIWLG